MKYSIMLAGLAMVAGTASFAGGLDRSGQSIAPIFEKGRYAELSFGSVRPSVDGVFRGVLNSGNVAPSYTQVGAAYKQDFGEKLSFGLILDQPFGADVSYDSTTPGYPLAGSTASISSTGLTAVLRYKFSDAFSVHAGVRMIQSSGSVSLPARRYTMTTSQEQDWGYLVGVAYEVPSIALRAALTYSSAVDVDFSTTEVAVVPGRMQVTLPQSVNFDLQTGIAQNTLLTFSARWVDWTSTNISPSLAPNLVSYKKDTITYSLGVARKFNETWSASAAIGYEAATGGLASNLSPTDGRRSLSVGVKYALNETAAISAGVSYARVGNATTETIGARFEDNSVLGVGIKMSFNF